MQLSGKRVGSTRIDLYAHCVCTLCGTEVDVPKSNLLNGKTIQCKKCNVKAGHETFLRGLWGGRLPDDDDRWIKARWDAIRQRCYDPTSRYYHRYGGRGIGLSDEFKNPLVFVAYAKSLPNARPEMQIDRIDNNKGYERGNLRWVTAKANCNNQERSLHVVYNGVEMPIGEFARDYAKMSYQFVRTLYHAGKTPEEIVNWEKDTISVTYNGETMSLMEFARRYVKHMSYQTVLKRYHQGKTLDELINWEKIKPKGVVYKGEWMSLRQFCLRYTKLSYEFAGKLYRNGVSLDDIVNWRKRYDTVTYNGEEMSFADFVRYHTTLSCTHARRLHRDGKSLDEIAHWKR